MSPQRFVEPTGPVITMTELVELPAGFWQQLGFSGDDLVEVTALAERVRGDVDLEARVAVLAGALADRVGRFLAAGGPGGADVFAESDARTDIEGHEVMGALPLLALACSTGAVRAFHRSRGVTDEIGWQSLADLGQQVSVHRDTYGAFGLHAHGWLTYAWSGALYWLGRLQFDLETYDRDGQASRWVLSTHIPGTGPMTPASVDESFALARAFFAEHFAEIELAEFFCSSWLLDPRLARLGPGTNTAAFQARWRLVGDGRPADGDAWFFVFRRRGEVDPGTLPRDTSLQRLVIDEISSGRSWRLCDGLIRFD